MTAETLELTSPRFTRRNHGTGHSYRLDGQKIPGVTTVLKSKSIPALPAWGARMAAEYAMDHWEELVAASPSGRYKLLSAANTAALKSASIRGTRIHSFGQKLAHGEAVSIPEEYLGPAEAYARFLDRWQIEAIHTEIPVCHTGYRYGGTGDLIATSPLLADGQPFWLDIKSGKGFYAETSLQLAAYRFCDVALIDGQECGAPETAELAYGAHVRPDDVEMLPVEAGMNSWKAFLHLLAVHRWDQACYDDPPVGRAIWPETVTS